MNKRVWLAEKKRRFLRSVLFFNTSNWCQRNIRNNVNKVKILFSSAHANWLSSDECQCEKQNFLIWTIDTEIPKMETYLPQCLGRTFSFLCQQLLSNTLANSDCIERKTVCFAIFSRDEDECKTDINTICKHSQILIMCLMIHRWTERFFFAFRLVAWNTWKNCAEPAANKQCTILQCDGWRDASEKENQNKKFSATVFLFSFCSIFLWDSAGWRERTSSSLYEFSPCSCKLDAIWKLENEFLHNEHAAQPTKLYDDSKWLRFIPMQLYIELTKSSSNRNRMPSHHYYYFICIKWRARWRNYCFFVQ